MNSEKVKEIKLALEEYIRQYSNFKGAELCESALTLSNELESENDTLHTNLCEWRKENQELKDRIAELENIGLNEKTTVGEYLREMERLKAELEKEQKNNLELEKEFTGYQLASKNRVKRKLKQFAERLKEKCEYNRKEYCCEATVSANDIDETLKEFL